MPKDTNPTTAGASNRAANPAAAAKLQGWFAGRLPDGWFAGPPAVSHDRDEIVVVGTLSTPDTGAADTETTAAACRARIEGFREDTRTLRMRIADEAEARFARKVAWGARCGAEEELFTTLSVPVMTRLRLPERQVLDTLVDAGVARSRSHALAWCVRLVGDHEGEWIDQLREAMVHVEKVRNEGPGREGPGREGPGREGPGTE
ncbi:MAG TPA: hypothetical protein VK549_04090 [Acidimicrobiia bacterium]|nr:hypothetical protein [Acidimicrobiia bacterium]